MWHNIGRPSALQRLPGKDTSISSWGSTLLAAARPSCLISAPLRVHSRWPRGKGVVWQHCICQQFVCQYIPAVIVQSAYKQLICAVTGQAMALYHRLDMLNSLMVFAGHPDFHVHSGESAIIVPRAVTGLGRRQVAVVAVAKHHTAVATTSCELFTWGSNRDGRLGYAAVDTQPTPRKYGFIPTQCNPLVPLVFRQSSTYACFCPCMHVCFKPLACVNQPVLTTFTATSCGSVSKGPHSR